MIEAQQDTKQAKEFFKKFSTLEAAFDSAVLNLYADQAILCNRRRYPNDATKAFTFSGKQYKDLVRRVLPLAKARGDKNRYSEIKYTAEKTGVRIMAKRYSLLKKYTSPISYLVKPDTKKKWLIYEGNSELRP